MNGAGPDLDPHREADRAALVGIVGNLVLTALKFAIGITSGSMAVVGDALHSFSDLLASLIVYLGIRQARKPPDAEHPFGHGDVEAIAGLLVAVSLTIIAYEFGRGSILALLRGEHGPIGSMAIFAAALSIVAKEAMARYTFAVSKRTHSIALEANAWDHRADAISSMAVLFGVVAAVLGMRILDPIFALGMAVIIGVLGIKIGRENINNLIGTLPDPEMTKKIEGIVMSFPSVKTVHKIRLHYFGSYAEVDMHVIMDQRMTIHDSHVITDEIILKVREQMPELAFVNVHVEPR